MLLNYNYNTTTSTTTTNNTNTIRDQKIIEENKDHVTVTPFFQSIMDSGTGEMCGEIFSTRLGLEQDFVNSYDVEGEREDDEESGEKKESRRRRNSNGDGDLEDLDIASLEPIMKVLEGISPRALLMNYEACQRKNSASASSPAVTSVAPAATSFSYHHHYPNVQDFIMSPFPNISHAPPADNEEYYNTSPYTHYLGNQAFQDNDAVMSASYVHWTQDQRVPNSSISSSHSSGNFTTGAGPCEESCDNSSYLSQTMTPTDEYSVQSQNNTNNNYNNDLLVSPKDFINHPPSPLSIITPKYESSSSSSMMMRQKDMYSVWSKDVCEAFIESLEIIPRDHFCRIKLLNKVYGRNELISMYIEYKTYKKRQVKQVSSHLQVTKRRLMKKIKSLSGSIVKVNPNDLKLLKLIDKGIEKTDENMTFFRNTFAPIVRELDSRKNSA